MQSNYYLWVDLETTGLDIHEDYICEIAAVLTKGFPDKFETIWAKNFPIILSTQGWARLIDEPFVHKMHIHSGLILDILENGVTLDRATYELVKDIQALPGTLPDDKEFLTLAGSGVSHFDIHFVRRCMPRLMDYIHWKMLDVGQLEEWRDLVGFETYDQAFPEQVARKTHRAMDDILHALDEAKWYVGIID